MRHATATIGAAPETSDQSYTAPDLGDAGWDGAAIEDFQRAMGIEGQPFPWSVRGCAPTPSGLRADIDLPDIADAALIDAATHLARLAARSNTRLMLPAAADGVRVAERITAGPASLDVTYRALGDDELVVDITVTDAEGAVLADIRGLRYAAVESAAAQDESHAGDDVARRDFSEIPRDELPAELRGLLASILGRELGMPASAIDLERPFPELGLDSMMAMTVLRETKKALGVDLSATMLWDHPTIASLAGFLAEAVAPQYEEPEPDDPEIPAHTATSVLDALLDSVESATAGGKSGI